MAAAYTALVSLMNTIDLIQSHSRHSFSFNQNQISSLLYCAISFLEFIESYSSDKRSKKVEDLEIQIASAAHMAEDLLESHVIEQILAGSTLKDLSQKSSSFLHDLQTRMKGMKEKVMKVPQKIRSKVDTNYRFRKMVEYGHKEESRNFSFDLERILENRIYPIGEKVRKIEEESRVKDEQTKDFIAAAASSRPLTSGKTTVVGFDDYSIQLMDVLTSQQSTRQIISVVGMGGLGKTSLAKYVYDNLLIVQHFDIRAWATVSQVDDVEEILLELLSCKKESNKDTVAELGEKLHKKLFGRRYLIVLDDMWNCNIWDKLRLYFPDNGNGSRVVVTTRLSHVASYFSSSSLVMDLLDEDKSWKLFCAKTFGEEEDCPVDLVKIGRNIVEQCKGLPLSIVVIAGHLRKSSRTWKQWAAAARNMTSILNSGEDQCLSILSMSYSHLPLYLKPCFLYMGVFPEDKEIPISSLIRFWAAEGFLRSDAAQSLEEIAEGYIKDLVDRNLISVGKKARTCKIHDLLREVCLKVGKEEKFFCVLKHPAGGSRECNRPCPICQYHDVRFLQSQSSTFLRILPEAREGSYKDEEVLDDGSNPDRLVPMFEHFNMRYISCRLQWRSTLDSRFVRTLSQIQSLIPYTRLPSSISLHWNLQTLVIGGVLERIIAPVGIWEMPQLKHVDISDIVRLPDPLPVGDDAFVMRNLQTLLTVENFKLGEEVCRRIPNIKDLKICYSSSSSSEYCQHNLGRFHKLDSMRCDFDQESNWRVFALKMTLPVSLRELWLASSCIHWEDLSMIGSLPCLEVLTLCYANSIRGNEWNPVEGEFLRLKSLVINNCVDLVSWNAEKSHFPVLENVSLGYAHKLGEFPCEIGDIPTLKRIYLDRCSLAAVNSVVKIAMEQGELGNEDIQFKIKCKDEEELQSVREMVENEGLETNNLRLKCYSV